MPVCGGFSDDREMTDEVREIAEALKREMEAALGETFAVFEPLSFSSQVVAGTNYNVKIHVGKDKSILAKVHKPLPHKAQPPNLMTVTWVA
ncbi:hypothetical protein CTAYLR_006673 [Chrysophaeum taylorii]|uniref:Cystatin domain-containing protein n=1 Tax=Chrysophaeum taylorii TaxID=2483200 RepID=A0AAD7UEB8_9STRA|nr:hypothetical protein CTAYLR_006673 [Chrysophaeum taylorii]